MFYGREGSGYLDLFAASKEKALSLPTALTLGDKCSPEQREWKKK